MISCKSRNTGKLKVWTLALKDNIENGMECAVFTSNSIKTKRTFKNITGISLQLTTIGNNMYKATI